MKIFTKNLQDFDLKPALLEGSLQIYYHKFSTRTTVDMNLGVMLESLSAAWPSDSERRFYDGHNRKVNGSTPIQASLLRLWIRCFTMIISAWWNLTSTKLKTEAKFKQKQATPRRVWIRPMHSATIAFS